MAEKRTMTIEVNLDLTPAQNQMRGFVAANNSLTIPVQSPVGAAVSGAGASGAAAVGLSATTAEQTAVATALGKAESSAAQYGFGPASQTAARSPFAGFFAVPRARALLGSAIFGLHEIGRTGSAIRNADAMAGFANTPEEANLLLAEAVEHGSQGFFSSLVFGIPNAFGIEGSPSQVAQRAREQVAMRRVQDDIRGRQFDIMEDRAYRNAYGFGGRTAAESARAQVQSTRAIKELELRARDLSSSINETVSRTEIYGLGSEQADIRTVEDFKLTGEGRKAAIQKLDQVNSDLQNAREQARFDARRRLEDLADSRRGVQSLTRRAQLVASGASERDLEWYDLGAVGLDRMVDAYRQRGFSGLLEEGNLTAERGKAVLFQRRRDDEFDAARSRSLTLANNYSAAGNPLQASLVELRANIESEAGQAERLKGPGAAAQVRAEGASRIGAFVAQANRGFAADVRGLTTSNAVLTAQLANDPLGAQLAAIEGNQASALANVTAPGIFGDIQRGLINASAGLQSQLATRNFERNRADVNLHLSGSIERAQLGISGGPSRFIQQEISSIVEQTETDARGLFRSGMSDEARQRRELGRLQLKQSEAEFYRSIQYREASPRGVYGTGTLGDVGSAYSTAQAAVSSAGKSEEEKPPTKGQADNIIRILTQLLTGGIPATAG